MCLSEGLDLLVHVWRFSEAANHEQILLLSDMALSKQALLHAITTSDEERSVEHTLISTLPVRRAWTSCSWISS
jgi:hypothetical protein